VADGVGAGGSVVATTLGVGAGVMTVRSGARNGRLQAASPSTRRSPTRPYARRLRGSDRTVTPRAYVDVADSTEPAPDRDSYIRRAPQTAAREQGLTCPVALIRTTTESAGT
jgi:hypothetical protein